jgi:phenylalanyl-tRNA synthetase alpha chain
MNERPDNQKKPQGHIHPLSLVVNEVSTVLAELGFEVADGPEIETEHYNFDALNVPADHPARDMQDTFWLKALSANKERLLLRTQTSSVQVRYMEKHTPPLRIVVPGKVFRNEATDATHEAQFYQVEGLFVDKDVSLAELKGTLTYFLRRIFGEETQIRFRPSFFPFTEPSVEVDASCWQCKTKGCALCKGAGWIEMGGAGMVNPKVFEACGIDPKVWRGFAFGFGIDRLVVLKYGLPDIRLSYTGDLRVVNQF